MAGLGFFSVALSGVLSAALSTAGLASLGGSVGFLSSALGGVSSSSLAAKGERRPGCKASAYSLLRVPKKGPVLRSPQGLVLPAAVKLRSELKYSHWPSGLKAALPVS